MRCGGVHVESRTKNECCAGSQITGIATALYVTAVIHHIHMRFRSALPSSAMLKTGFPVDVAIAIFRPSRRFACQPLTCEAAGGSEYGNGDVNGKAGLQHCG